MKLQKFRKYGKQKGIAIGCVIALLLTIAGVNLYRTFAINNEKEVVPNLDNDSTTIAFTINGETKSDESFPNKEDGYIVSKITCDNDVTANWDNDSWSLMNIQNPNNTKKIKCTIDFKFQYKETLLAGADPVLDTAGTLIPVKISETDGSVTVADTTEDWYKYGEKRWANAIIPTDEAKGDVAKLSAGKTITEDQIESYFVWIPKYKYKIQTLSTSTTPKAFDIVFGTEDTTDQNRTECPTPKTSGNSGSCAVGEYMTHPAFTAFGNVKGLWVGKFETGYKDASSKSAAEQGTANSEKVVIKPNQYSWRSIKVTDMFKTAKEYQESLESHMMKNTEWGAVAYLTQSNYGRCTNGSCTEITINNNSNYVTGFAGSSVSQSKVASNPGVDTTDTYNYKNPNSTKASTTGNYTGIYDMSGGAAEYVMGVMYASGNSKPSYSNSGFTDTTFPTESKYYDIYKYGTTYNDTTAYSRRILGDATAETNGWYSDDAHFVYSSYPWVLRGGVCVSGTSDGAFSYTNNSGNASGTNGFRITLAI